MYVTLPIVCNWASCTGNTNIFWITHEILGCIHVCFQIYLTQYKIQVYMRVTLTVVINIYKQRELKGKQQLQLLSYTRLIIPLCRIYYPNTQANWFLKTLKLTNRESCKGNNNCNLRSYSYNDPPLTDTNLHKSYPNQGHYFNIVSLAKHTG